MAMLLLVINLWVRVVKAWSQLEEPKFQTRWAQNRSSGMNKKLNHFQQIKLNKESVLKAEQVVWHNKSNKISSKIMRIRRNSHHMRDYFSLRRDNLQ